MAFVEKDRVKETTTTTGTGTLTLAGAVTGFQSFSAIGNGNTCAFVIEAVSGGGVPTGDWEVSVGTYTSSGTTLSRTTVLASSNGGSAVNFGAGTKNVYVVRGADLFTGRDADASPDGAADYVLTYDASAAALKKVLLDNLPGSGGLSNLAIPGLCQRRLTLESGVSVSTTNQTSKSTIYWTAHTGNAVALYDGSNWNVYTPPEIGFPVVATSAKNYDTFASVSSATPSSTDTGTDIVTFGSATGWSTGAAVMVNATGGGLTSSTWYYWNAASSTTGSFHTTLANALAGTSKVDLTASITASVTGITLSQSSAWTNDTTRADALTTQDGAYVLSGKLWLGSYRASGTDLTSMEFWGDSPKMFLSNCFNPVMAAVGRIITGTWSYGTSTWRQTEGSANNQFEILTCVNSGVDCAIDIMVGGAGDSSIGIGVDSTTPHADSFISFTSTVSCRAGAGLYHKALGYRVYKGCELRVSSGTVTFYGDDTFDGNVYVRSRIYGRVHI